MVLIAKGNVVKQLYILFIYHIYALGMLVCFIFIAFCTLGSWRENQGIRRKD